MCRIPTHHYECPHEQRRVKVADDRNNGVGAKRCPAVVLSDNVLRRNASRLQSASPSPPPSSPRRARCFTKACAPLTHPFLCTGQDHSLSQCGGSGRRCDLHVLHRHTAVRAPADPDPAHNSDWAHPASQRHCGSQARIIGALPGFAVLRNCSCHHKLCHHWACEEPTCTDVCLIVTP